MPFLLPGAMRHEVLRCAASIEEATGSMPRFYRPPFGFMTPGQARFVRNLGYEPVLGDVYPEDPHLPGVERIVARVMPRLRDGSILILHDGSPIGSPSRTQTVEALAIILAEAALRGLRGTTVAEVFPKA
jgi:peptidoglycan/xylan/chitin deacetylase (PgdA/CDA1 family)